MKFETIGAGAVALAFAREVLATGHEVVLSSRGGPESLAGKVAALGREPPRLQSGRPQASTTSCSPFPGRSRGRVTHEVTVDPEIAGRAQHTVERMMALG